MSRQLVYLQFGSRDALLLEAALDLARRELLPFQTRLLVCRPADPSRFDGTVVVEWLNVSGGGDGSPDWFFLHRHLMREGAAWVGVSAQKAGIDGGGLFDSGQHLKSVAPERYAALTHPGDAFAFNIFSQAGAALRTGAGPLADLAVETLLAVGESQSAMFLVTYVNAVDPQARIYDGFVIHGRGASGASLGGKMRRPSEGAPGAGHRIREDVRVPVITLQSETDVVRFAGFRARQPDGDRFRLWEIAGAAHFDTYGLVAAHRDDGSLSAEELAALIAPTDEILGQKAASLVNSGPQQHCVLNAAIAHLEAWVRRGSPPPGADCIQGLPDVDLRGTTLEITSGIAAGRKLNVVDRAADVVVIGYGAGNAAGLEDVAEGDSSSTGSIPSSTGLRYGSTCSPGPPVNCGQAAARDARFATLHRRRESSCTYVNRRSGTHRRM